MNNMNSIYKIEWNDYGQTYVIAEDISKAIEKFMNVKSEAVEPVRIKSILVFVEGGEFIA